MSAAQIQQVGCSWMLIRCTLAIEERPKDPSAVRDHGRLRGSLMQEPTNAHPDALFLGCGARSTARIDEAQSGRYNGLLIILANT